MTAPRPEFDEQFDIPRGADIRVTQLRREESRARRQRLQTRQAASALAFLALLFLVVRVLAPAAPDLVVTWPNAQKLGRATLENGATVAIRAGQPFAVSPTDARNWDVSWNYTGVGGAGVPVAWPAAGSLDKLELHCRARAVGWQKTVSWLWPTRRLFLQGTAPVALDKTGRRFVVMPMSGAPIRLSSRVVAAYEVSPEARWNERALPLLEEAVRNAPSLKSGATWTIFKMPSQKSLKPATSSTGNVAATGDKAPGDSAPDDAATYAVLSPDSFTDATKTLVEIAQIIAHRAPQTNIKWIAREKPGAKQPRALLRLDFDQMPTLTKRRRHRKAAVPIGARGAWVVRAGGSKATPFDWWSAPLAPSPNANSKSHKL